jgi:hypothetical protein
MVVVTPAGRRAHGGWRGGMEMRRARLAATVAVMTLALTATPAEVAGAAGTYEGSWSGTETFIAPGNNTFNFNMGFEVVGDDVTSVDLCVAVVGSGCSLSFTDTTIDLSADPAPIVDDQFSFAATTVDGSMTLSVDMGGTFGSAAEASGSVTSSATSGSCEISLTGQWEASRPLPEYQPDALIGTKRGSYMGDDVYNTTGKAQTIKKTVARGHTQIFYIVSSNDGSKRDKVYAQGSVGSGGVTLRYYDVYSHGKDVTDWVKRGSIWWSIPATSGNWGLLKVVVSVSDDATPGTRSFKVVETSRNDPDAADAVVMKIKVSG